MTVTDIASGRQFFVENSHTDLHGNSTRCLYVDSRSQTDTWTDGRK